MVGLRMDLHVSMIAWHGNIKSIACGAGPRVCWWVLFGILVEGGNAGMVDKPPECKCNGALVPMA